MPKIAQYNQTPVSTQVVQQPRAQDAPAAAFGEPAAKGFLNLVQAAADVKQRIDITAAEESLVQFERDKNDLFFNPDSGYFNTQGRTAYDGSATAVEALDELKSKYGDTLNAQSKLMFDKSADQIITRNRSDITRHAAKGLKTWEISTIESQVENSLENASLYWNDPDRLKVQNVVGRQAIIDSSTMLGLSPEATAEKLQTFESSFALASVEAAVQSSADAGKEALIEYGDELEGPDKLKLDKLIERKVKIEKTQNDANEAVLTAANLVDQYDNLKDINEEVNKNEDPEFRKKLRTETTAQYNRKKKAESESSNESYQSIIGRVNKGETALEIQRGNSEEWLNMTDSQRNNILAGKHMVTNQVLLANLRSLPVKEKAKLNPTDYASDLKPSDLQKLVGEVNSAKKGQQGSRVMSLSSKSLQAAVSAFGSKTKWSKKSGGLTEKGKKANEFLNELQNAVDEAETENQRKLTPDEENKIIGDFTRQIVVERSRFGFDILASDTEIDLSNAPAKDVQILNRIINDTPGIDLVDLTDAYQFLIDKELPVTATTLNKVYKQGAQ